MKYQIYLRRGGRSGSRKRLANFEDGTLSYRENGFGSYSRRRGGYEAYDDRVRRAYNDVFHRTRSFEFSRRRSIIYKKKESNTMFALKLIALGLTMLGALSGVFKCCVKACCQNRSVRRPRVAVNPAGMGDIELQQVQNNTDEAHVQNTENTEEDVEQTVFNPDESSSTDSPPTYETVCNGTSDMSAIPPPSYEEVVGPGYSA